MAITAFTIIGCNKNAGSAASGAASAPTAPAAPTADSVDRGTLEAGKTYTKKLLFWAKNRGLVGDTLVDNVHFDDGANARLVFTFDKSLADTIGKLEQGKLYSATFTYAASDDATQFGALTKVE